MTTAMGSTGAGVVGATTWTAAASPIVASADASRSEATPTRLFVAGRPLDLPASPLPAGDWLVEAEDGSWSLLPGIASVGDRLVVVLPRSYAHVELDPVALFPSVALFVSSLARYLRDRPATTSVDDPELEAREDALLAVGRPEELVDRVEAALLLWKDHAEHGPLIVSAPRTHDDVPGRVLWERAVRLGAPVESGAGLVFRHMPRTSVRPDPRHELTELHQATCEEIGARFGLGPAPHVPPVGTKEAFDRIERAERVCFADRPRRVLSLLRRYHAGRDAQRAGGGVRGLFARDYAYVWERMLKVVLRDEGRAHGTLRGRYRLPDGTTQQGLDLRPDVLIRARRRDGRSVLAILDAKDYAAGSLPRSADLSKQVLYRLLLSNLIDPAGPPLAHVGNAFLFPALVPGAGLRIRAVHDLTGEALPGHPGRVVGLDVDLEQVADAYVAGRALERLRDSILAALFDVGQGTPEREGA